MKDQNLAESGNSLKTRSLTVKLGKCLVCIKGFTVKGYTFFLLWSTSSLLYLSFSFSTF